MYKSILVGTDGSPSASGALSAAVALARAVEAQLHVVCVYDAAHTSTAIAATAGVPSSLAEIDQAARQHTEAVLEEARRLAAADGVRVTVHGCTGSPGETLLAVADAEGADLIVVGNRGMKGVRRLLGSVPNHVTHHASCAVLIVPTT